MMATLTTKAQIKLPKGIRELLKLEPGDKVDFTPQPDGRVTVAKAPRAAKQHLPPCAACYLNPSVCTVLTK